MGCGISKTSVQQFRSGSEISTKSLVIIRTTSQENNKPQVSPEKTTQVEASTGTQSQKKPSNMDADNEVEHREEPAEETGHAQGSASSSDVEAVREEAAQDTRHKTGSDSSSDGDEVDEDNNQEQEDGDENGTGQGQGGEVQGQKKPRKKLTPEEVTERYLKKIARTRKITSNIMDNDIYTDDNVPSESFRANILSAGKLYYSLRGAPKSDINKLRQEIGQIFIDTNFLNCLGKFVVTTLTEKKYKNLEGTVISDFNNPLKNGLKALINFTNAVPAVCECLCKLDGFLHGFRSSLEDMVPADGGDAEAKAPKIKGETLLVKTMLGIVHNIGMHDSCVPYLQSHNYTPVLLSYMDSKLGMTRMSAIAALADILDEKECDLLQSRREGIKFLITIFERSLKKRQHINRGWSSKELARTVGRLARNDANKKMLVEQGALPLLLKLFKSHNTEEQKEAIESLWVLAFDEDNKQKMMEEPGLMEAVVEEYRSSTDKNIRKPCQGLLWNLREILLQSEEYADLGKELSVSSTKSKEVDQKAKGHVMISYQWANQEVLIKVKDCLRQNGYDVWMDIDNMGGSTLQAMAEAIENASVVLIAMSRRYKDSPNCRAEAEYAFSKRKSIVPLVMELGYRPDGWLGMILGSKLFFDFSGKYSFDSKIDGLNKELQRSLTDGEPGVSEDAGVRKPFDFLCLFTCSHCSVLVQSAKTTTAFRSPAVKPDTDSIKQWTSADVAKWLTKHNLKGNKLEKLTGREVAFLKQLRYEAPEFFYHTVETKLDVTDLLGFVNFTEAMDDLMS
ncbi:uncharacterized protein LOC124272159 [Haliotis rubra]|uniref:uncharacterized protein LOC124272159 n=1 Tax=Haliotis rubra TaxID=36100 RepID=UPI001EE51702|nr:uncharacterized protein LOC124272159 [Haliotis rubra]